MVGTASKYILIRVNYGLQEFIVFHQPELNMIHGVLESMLHCYRAIVVTTLLTSFLYLSHLLSWMRCLKNSKHTIYKELRNLRLSINQGFEHPCHPDRLFFEPSRPNMFYLVFCSLAPLLFCKRGANVFGCFRRKYHPWQHSLQGFICSCRQAASLKSGSCQGSKPSCSLMTSVLQKMWPKNLGLFKHVGTQQFWVVGLFGISLRQEYVHDALKAP